MPFDGAAGGLHSLNQIEGVLVVLVAVICHQQCTLAQLISLPSVFRP